MYAPFELSSGEFLYGESAYAGGVPFPAFEPAYEPCYGSHEMVERLRRLVETFDSVGMHRPKGNEMLIANLFVLSDLAHAAALHMRGAVDEELEYERLWDQAKSEQRTERIEVAA